MPFRAVLTRVVPNGEEIAAVRAAIHRSQVGVDVVGKDGRIEINHGPADLVCLLVYALGEGATSLRPHVLAHRSLGVDHRYQERTLRSGRDRVAICIRGRASNRRRAERELIRSISLHLDGST